MSMVLEVQRILAMVAFGEEQTCSEPLLCT